MRPRADASAAPRRRRPRTRLPGQALESVAAAFLAEEDLPGELRAGIVGHMVGVHQSVRAASARFEQQLRRHNYVTVSGGGAKANPGYWLHNSKGR